MIDWSRVNELKGEIGEDGKMGDDGVTPAGMIAGTASGPKSPLLPGSA